MNQVKNDIVNIIKEYWCYFRIVWVKVIIKGCKAAIDTGKNPPSIVRKYTTVFTKPQLYRKNRLAAATQLY